MIFKQICIFIAIQNHIFYLIFNAPKKLSCIQSIADYVVYNSLEVYVYLFDYWIYINVYISLVLLEFTSLRGLVFLKT